MSHYIGIILLAVGGLIDLLTLPAEYMGFLEYSIMRKIWLGASLTFMIGMLILAL